MPQYNRAELGRMATESGFVRDTFEFLLLDLFLRLRVKL